MALALKPLAESEKLVLVVVLVFYRIRKTVFYWLSLCDRTIRNNLVGVLVVCLFKGDGAHGGGHGM